MIESKKETTQTKGQKKMKLLTIALTLTAVIGSASIAKAGSYMVDERGVGYVCSDDSTGWKIYSEPYGNQVYDTLQKGNCMEIVTTNNRAAYIIVKDKNGKHRGMKFSGRSKVTDLENMMNNEKLTPYVKFKIGDECC
jgi:hypothetical protein